jgi:hypothetical protein
MTESDWLNSTNPVAMLDHLRGRGSDRKFRLFACACCRLIWDRFPDQANRDLVTTVEEYPDGKFEDPAIQAAGRASSAREGEFSGDPASWVAKYLGRGFYKFTAADSALAVVAKAVWGLWRAALETFACPL